MLSHRGLFARPTKRGLDQVEGCGAHSRHFLPQGSETFPRAIGWPLPIRKAPFVALTVNLPCISKKMARVVSFYTNLTTWLKSQHHRHMRRRTGRSVKKKMVFPRRALVVSSFTGCFLWFMGFPKWAAFVFSFLGFLGMGGLKYCKLIYRTLPTDLWCALFRMFVTLTSLLL